MKQMKYLFVAMIAIMMSALAYADKPIAVEKLPAEVRTFIQTNFPDKKIIFAEKDRNSFDCHLNDGTELEFTKKGVWKKIDCHKTAVPSAIIPEAIQEYVKSNFPDAFVTSIETERYGYDLELSNKLDLKFNHEGVLIGMDD